MAWLRAEKERPNILGRNENLCWVCNRAIAGCSWSKRFVPVKGWDAEPDGDTYKIRSCPDFSMMESTKKAVILQ